MSNLPDTFSAVVIGSTGGIGAAVTQALLDDPRVERVHGLARSPQSLEHPKLVTGHLDLLDEPSIASAAQTIGSPRLVFVATGLLHDTTQVPEKSWRSLDASALSRVYALNAIGPALVAKHLLPRLPRTGKAVFAAISARVGSIEDNRLGGWHGYRASKAALNQLIRCLAIEQAIKWPEALCVGLHPGTVDTALSLPFQSGVKTLFTPQESAARMLSVIERLTPADSGQLFAFDGQRIPF